MINNQKYRNAIAVILRMFKGTTIPGSSVKEFEVLVMTGLDSSVADEGERLTLPLPVTHFDIPKVHQFYLLNILDVETLLQT